MKKSIVCAGIAALMLSAATVAIWPAARVVQADVLPDEQLRTMRERIEPLRRAGSEGQAKELAAQVLELARARYGANHIEMARSLEALAELNSHLEGLPDDMKPVKLQARVIAIKRNVLGTMHLEVAKSIEQLASLHYMDDDNGRAAELAAEALVILQKLLGKSHPDLAHALMLLGNARGDRAPLEQAVQVREKALGANHVDTAISIFHLGSHAYRHSEPDAEALLQRALPVLEGVALGGPTDIKDQGLSLGLAMFAMTMLEAIFRDGGRQSELAAMMDRQAKFMEHYRQMPKR